MPQIPNPNYEEELAKFTEWQAEDKLRTEAAKKIPKPRKGRKLSAVVSQEAGEVPQEEEVPPLIPQETPSPKPVRPKKNIDIVLYGIWGPGVPGKLVPDELTATSAAPVSIKVLK